MCIITLLKMEHIYVIHQIAYKKQIKNTRLDNEHIGVNNVHRRTFE